MRRTAGGSTVIVFARLGGGTSDPSQDLSSQLPRHAIDLLRGWGARLILVSAYSAEYVRQVQQELQIVEAFVCDGGAALHVPPRYRPDVETSRDPDGWETFRFNPPDTQSAVTFLCDLFLNMGHDDMLTIGVGCDYGDYGMLSAVDVPVVVRDVSKEQSGLLRYVPGAYLTNATGADGWAEALIAPEIVP